MMQRNDDEILLIDYLLGRCDQATAAEVEERLRGERELEKLHTDLQNTLSAVGLVVDVEPPADLVDKTLGRIRHQRQIESLLARQELKHSAIRPTFAMRELITVAAAVVVMALVFVPSVRQARHIHRRKLCETNVGNIGNALNRYAIANDGYLPSAGATRRRWLRSDSQPAVSNSVGLFRLVRDQYVDSPVRFQCPAVGGGSFVVRAGMTDFPAGKFISYSYQHTLTPSGLTQSNADLAGETENMVILADSTPIFRDGRFLRDRIDDNAGDNHQGTGQNVLYLDYHVQWQEGPAVGVRGNNIFLIDGITEYRGDEAPAAASDTFLLPAYSNYE